MKNKFKYLGAGILALTALSAQAETIFQDDFSTGLSRWDLDYNYGDRWTTLSRYAITPPAATLDLGGLRDTGEYSSLISPVIDLTNVDGAELTFMQRLDMDDLQVPTPNYASVQVAQLGTNNWITVWSSEIDVLGKPMTMTSVDLSAFDGQQIQFLFRHDVKNDWQREGGQWNVDDVAINGVIVGNEHLKPVAEAGSNLSGNLDTQFNFDGVQSVVHDNLPLSYAWNFGDGSYATGSTPTHQYSERGNFTVSLIVDDGIYQSVADTIVVNVRNRYPQAVAEMPFTAVVGFSLNLDASASYDVDGDALFFEWSYNRNGESSTIIGTNAIESFSFPETGDFWLKLRVYDYTGVVSIDGYMSSLVSVTGQAPIADAGADQQVGSRASVTLDGSFSSDPEGSTLDYQWLQVSGSTVSLTGANTAVASFLGPRVSKNSFETLVFELTVTDADGMTSVDSIIVTASK